MSAVIKYTCKRHPKYSGINPPRARCEACDAVYSFSRWIVVPPLGLLTTTDIVLKIERVAA